MSKRETATIIVQQGGDFVAALEVREGCLGVRFRLKPDFRRVSQVAEGAVIVSRCEVTHPRAFAIASFLLQV